MIVEFCSEKDGIRVFPCGDHEFDVVFGRRCPEVPVSRQSAFSENRVFLRLCLTFANKKLVRCGFLRLLWIIALEKTFLASSFCLYNIGCLKIAFL